MPKHNRGMSKIAKLRASLLQLLDEHQNDDTIPTSSRFLFYELVQRGIISKERKPGGGRRPDQDMNDALTDLRESGQIPWDWIVDETRSLESYAGYPSIKEGLKDQLPILRLDPWNGDLPLILTESRSLAGVLRNLCFEYRVQIAPTNGQCGGFLHTTILPILKEYQSVLYLGDWDLSGNMIEANTRRVLEHDVLNLCWERLALTREQVDQYHLPVIIKHDRRFANGGEHEAVETEALSQRIIVDIVRSRLEELLPQSLQSVLAKKSNGNRSTGCYKCSNQKWRRFHQQPTAMIRDASALH
jgi:hypothetical protein